MSLSALTPGKAFCETYLITCRTSPTHQQSSANAAAATAPASGSEEESENTTSMWTHLSLDNENCGDMQIFGLWMRQNPAICDSCRMPVLTLSAPLKSHDEAGSSRRRRRLNLNTYKIVLIRMSISHQLCIQLMECGLRNKGAAQKRIASETGIHERFFLVWDSFGHIMSNVFYGTTNIHQGIFLPL